MGVVAEVIAPEHSVNGIVLTLVRSDWKSCLWRVGGGGEGEVHRSLLEGGRNTGAVEEIKRCGGEVRKEDVHGGRVGEGVRPEPAGIG